MFYRAATTANSFIGAKETNHAQAVHRHRHPVHRGDRPASWVASVDRFVFGVPFIYLWIFMWFVLTSLCMLVCWLMFDRHEADDAQSA